MAMATVGATQAPQLMEEENLLEENAIEFDTGIADCESHWREIGVSAALMQLRPEGVTWGCDGGGVSRARPAMEDYGDQDGAASASSCRQGKRGNPAPFSRGPFDCSHGTHVVGTRSRS